MLTRFFRWSLVLGFAASALLVNRPDGGHAVAAAKKAAKHAARHPARVRGKKAIVVRERYVAPIKGGMPNVQARCAMVIDGDSGRELFSRSPDHERPIASISKLAATLVVMDKGLDLDGLTTISKTDIDVARGGAKSRLLDGMTVSNRDLLHAALMGSDNRAVPALGRAVKLTPSELTAGMNAKAAELGLKHTRFRDPTGLSTDNVSTPRETIVMLRAVMNHPVLGPITHRLEYDAHPVGRPPIKYVNTYKPAVRTNIQVMGGKTGYNDDARYCLVIATRIDGHPYFMSFLGNEGKLTRFGDVARVADWVTLHKPKGTPAPLPEPTAGDAVATEKLPVGVAAPVDEPAAPVDEPAAPPATAAVGTQTATASPPASSGVH
ncbi:MAG TPA: serine hydrolase [Polyangia bacterium]|nr:serine hydrolase [Polyangia bacterium]